MKKKKAFTLAEVLITLGIIGIVAAMTLPTLVAKYKKIETVTKLKKFYTVMSQATNIAIAQNGPMENWDGFTSHHNGTEMEKWFDKYLKPNLKITNKWIDRDDETGKELLFVSFGDGSIMSLTNWAASTPDIDEDTGSDNNHSNENYNGLIHANYYTNAKATKKENRKNCINKFAFLFYNPLKKQYAFFPYAYTANTPDKYNREFFLNQAKKNDGGGQYCSIIIMYDGWEIKDDYPFKF